MIFTPEEATILSAYLHTLYTVAKEKDQSYTGALEALLETFEHARISVDLSTKQLGILHGVASTYVNYSATLDLKNLSEEQLTKHATSLRVFNNLLIDLERGKFQ